VAKNFNSKFERFPSLVELGLEFFDGGAMNTFDRWRPLACLIGLLIVEEHADVEVEQLVDGSHFDLGRLGMLGYGPEPLGQCWTCIAFQACDQLGYVDLTSLGLKKYIRPVSLMTFGKQVTNLLEMFTAFGRATPGGARKKKVVTLTLLVVVVKRENNSKL